MAMFRSSGEVESRTPVVSKTEKNDYISSAYCDICLQCWDSETEVEIHRNTSHKNHLMRLLRESNKNICRACVKSYADKDELLCHIKSYHLLTNRDAVRIEHEIFICDCCSAVFFNKQLLQAHILIFHTNLDRMNTFTECPKCHRSYRLKTMWYHFQGHDIQSVSCCKICLTKCKDRRHLSRHVNEHIKYLYCDICQYQSKNEEFFKEHLATRHGSTVVTNEIRNVKWKPYFMPKAADYKPKLQNDTPIKGLLLELFFETELRVCVLCREICIGESDAIAHVKSAHMQRETPRVEHQCTCGETFNNKVLLKHHIFKSTGTHAEAKENSEVVYAIVILPDDSTESETTT